MKIYTVKNYRSVTCSFKSCYIKILHFLAIILLSSTGYIIIMCIYFLDITGTLPPIVVLEEKLDIYHRLQQGQDELKLIDQEVKNVCHYLLTYTA